MSATQLFSKESSFYDMLWNMCPKSPPLSSENLSLYFASPTSRSTSSFVDIAIEGIPTRSFIFYLFQHSQVSFAHLYFFCRCLELINQTFLKASRPNCNIVFRPKKMNSGLCLFIFRRVKAEISQDSILKTTAPL